MSGVEMVTRKLEGDRLTPVAVFQRLKGRRKFLLESSLKHTENGRYSFIGAEPVKSFIGTASSLIEIDHVDGIKHETPGRPLELLKERVPQTAAGSEFPFAGGLVGYIGYDAIRAYEPVGATRKDSLGMPPVHLHQYGTAVVFDHLKQDVTIVSFSGEQGLDRAEAELAVPETEAENGAVRPLLFASETAGKVFRQLVDEAKAHIRQGDVFQVVLSQRLHAAFGGDPFTLYRRLRKQNPSPYQFYVEFDDYTVVGASPESLLSVRGGTIRTNPIAGTRPRGADADEDGRLAEELLADPKERAEHMMLVDLSRNDVGRVAAPGTVAIPKYMEIEKYQHVMHIVSEVTGTLAEAMHPLDALASCLPAGTVSGAPKVRAMQLIREFEEEQRGVYGGAVGYFGFNGNLDVALAIRTFVVKDGRAYIQAGAGIVHDSDPQKEYEETLHKARSLMEVFG
ncbi:anthranilate synthase component I [Indiicoccus explosivorum]|uniref:anthranilate synthase component I n=1 Tax=Indiicoccus explosivorum TaxID=1917864 RepID=UPI0012D7AB97